MTSLQPQPQPQKARPQQQQLRQTMQPQQQQQQPIQQRRGDRYHLFAFILLGTTVALDYSYMLTTTYTYINNTKQQQHVTTYYALILCLYHATSYLFELLTDKYLRRTHTDTSTTTMFTNIVLLLQLLGIVLYLIPHNIAYLLVGRSLLGVGDAYVRICARDIAKTHQSGGSGGGGGSQRDGGGGGGGLWWVGVCHSTGYMAGPLVVLLFHRVQLFSEGDMLHIEGINIAGILVVCMLVFALVAVNLLSCNCNGFIVCFKTG